MYYLSTPVFLNIGALTFHTCNYGQAGVLSGMARMQVFQTSEGLAAIISTLSIRSSGGGFLDQITSQRVKTCLR